ncbi:GNAT family N-acetyltransferase [Methylomonas sp. 11b]|uniref:GNAT family N-acetyltransferase n=1 Tax=Methylomonas sp. 11b TaxID=1168169 RepID=UPI000479CEF5|nr:GNAT family N-acetyltransferase [Methylomonas sp. 11b]
MNKVFITQDIKSYCEEYIELEFDPDVRKYLGGLPRKSKEEMRIHINLGEYDSQGIYAIVDVSTGAFVGRCGYLDDNGEKEIYIVISKKYWGNRLAKPALQELFKIIGRKNITAIIDPENIKSIKLFRSLGFQESCCVISNCWQQKHIKFRLDD